MLTTLNIVGVDSSQLKKYESLIENSIKSYSDEELEVVRYLLQNEKSMDQTSEKVTVEIKKRSATINNNK